MRRGETCTQGTFFQDAQPPAAGPVPRPEHSDPGGRHPARGVSRCLRVYRHVLLKTRQAKRMFGPYVHQFDPILFDINGVHLLVVRARLCPRVPGASSLLETPSLTAALVEP